MLCVVGSPDVCDYGSEVSWCSDAGRTYYVHVGGYWGYQGNFELTAAEDGAACDVPRCAPPGACCFDWGECRVLDAYECAGEGGTFAGSNTECPGACA